jgi:hypothetical protein
MQIIVVRPGRYVTTIGTTSHTYIYAKAKPNLWLLLCIHAYIHTCATAKLESQRTTGTKALGEGGAVVAGRTKLLLYYCRTQEPRDTRGTGGCGGIKRDTRGAGGHTGDPRDTTGAEGIAGGSGGTLRGQEGTTGGSERAVRPEGPNKIYIIAVLLLKRLHIPYLHLIAV